MATADEPRILEGWETFQRVSLIVGIAGLTLCLVGAWFSRQQFFQSYLFAYVFWLGIALGLPGHRHAAQSFRRRLGHGHPSPARVGNENAAVNGFSLRAAIVSDCTAFMSGRARRLWRTMHCCATKRLI